LYQADEFQIPHLTQSLERCMQFFMKHFSSLLIILTFCACKAQTSTKQLRITEIGWTLQIPTDANFLNSSQFDTLQRKVIKSVNDAYDVSSDEEFKKVRALFTIRKGQFNFINSSINHYDSALSDTWQNAYAKSKDMLFDLLEKQKPELQVIDTSTSVEIIDGLEFEKLYIKTFYPRQKLTMFSYWFYRKHDNYDFSVNISYIDEFIGKQYLEILRSSKFDK
jgi:hypothetical protein